MADASDTSGRDSLGQERLPAAYPQETITRRRLFERSAMAVGGLGGAIVGLPAIGFAVGPVFDRAESRWQTVGDISEFSSDTYTQKTAELEAGIGIVGKTTVYVRKRHPRLDPPGTPEYVAVSTRCTHLGCPVKYMETADRFVCPCHGGVYDFLGRRTGGPPVRPLDRFNTRVDGRQVQVGYRFSVNQQLRRYSPRDAGEPLGGLWQYIYPRRFTTAPIQQR